MHIMIYVIYIYEYTSKIFIKTEQPFRISESLKVRRFFEFLVFGFLFCFFRYKLLVIQIIYD